MARRETETGVGWWRSDDENPKLTTPESRRNSSQDSGTERKPTPDPYSGPNSKHTLRNFGRTDGK